MNYLQARQRKFDGRWHYTAMNDGRIWSVGYCGQPNSACDESAHATREEAEDCYTKWLLDTKLVLDGFSSTAKHKCQVCGAWTQRWTEVRGHMNAYYLCDAHRNKETVAKLFGRVGQIITSY